MTELLIVAIAVYAFAMVSKRSSMSPVTAPMVFTAIGLAVGTAGTGWFDLSLKGEAVSILVEATLVLVLFTDAVRIDLRVLRRNAGIPIRLLSIGLPLTIALGTAAAALVFADLNLAEAALVAAVLAPTDAALGQAVVSDPRLPPRIRQSINVESGLNDGIVVPVVAVLLALAAAETDNTGAGEWGAFIARQLGFGLTVGLVVGVAGGWLLHRRASAAEIEGIYRQLATLALAAGAFAGAEVLDGNGFIAAFVAGLAFGRVAREECTDVQDFAEDEGELLTAITFLVFGALLAGPRLGDLTWQIALYAALSLTVVRIIPALIALVGSGTYLETRLFIAWFGPRGLASILFALLVLEELDSPHVELIATIAMWTILASVYLHGLTASPWAGRLGRKLESAPAHMPERAPVTELPTRRRLEPGAP